MNSPAIASLLFLAACAPASAAPAKPAPLADAGPHWAFQPVKRPPVPPIRNPQSAIRNPLDSFILAKLQSKGMTLSPPASRETLIRRVTLDLIGLPPTPAEIDAFAADTSPKAFETLIERLLASPHYGERWGRHWLDLARFAETDGFEHDAVRPHSWRYRDYVVRAFNADKPYDQFIREQLAGDELWQNSKPETQNPELLVATGFTLLGPDMVDSADQVQRRINTLNDMTDTVSSAMLGLTLGCARCHDHKFEPFSQRDYFAMQAHFTPAKFVREQPIAGLAERAAYDAALKLVNDHPTMRELTSLEDQARAKLRQKKLAKLSPEAQIAHNTPSEKRTAEESNLVLETQAMLDVFDKELTESLSAGDKARRAALRREVAGIQKPPPLPMTMALANSNGPPAKTFLLRRGEYSQPGEEVGPGYPSVIAALLQPDRNPLTPDSESGAPSPLVGPVLRSSTAEGGRGERDGVRGVRPAPVEHIASSGRRTALANWLASPDNPLTARVMVNRIWQHHFGRGLVTTPSDFGTRGQRPTHPELLDWLASEFIARGWSVKEMHRLILTSATYRQSGVPGAGEKGRVGERENLPPAPSLPRSLSPPLAADPANSLYSRFPRVRLEGEVIRDSLLALSGRLNPAMGGPGVFPPIPAEMFKGAKGWTASANTNDHTRRSLYIFARRNLRFPFLEVFDAPDSNFSCPERLSSTTAPQSLTLLNAEDVLTAAKLLASRLEKEATTTDDRITLAYRITLARTPTAQESRLARDFLTQSPLSEFCRVLFNLNAFVYVE